MNTSDTPTILKRLREQRGLSQQQVADLLNIQRTTYVKYETGASKPVRKLMELANLFGVTTDYLLGVETDTSPDSEQNVDTSFFYNNEKVQELQSYYLNFSDEQRDELLKYARYLAHDSGNMS